MFVSHSFGEGIGLFVDGPICLELARAENWCHYHTKYLGLYLSYIPNYKELTIIVFSWEVTNIIQHFASILQAQRITTKREYLPITPPERV
jgi:hypothetical protein